MSTSKNVHWFCFVQFLGNKIILVLKSTLTPFFVGSTQHTIFVFLDFSSDSQQQQQQQQQPTKKKKKSSGNKSFLLVSKTLKE